MVKRGGFAMDSRTGQVVKVAEKGGGNCMVRPAYKSDAYWTDESNLVQVPDPHAWKGGELVLLLFVLVACGLVGWAGWHALDSVEDVWHRGLFGVFMPVTVCLGQGLRWTGLFRD
jgi:hypothetical protein